MKVRWNKVQMEAVKLLQKYNVRSAPVPLENIADSLGVAIRKTKLDSKVDGFLYSTTGKSVIGVNQSNVRPRQRFTIAHELGHFLLHRRQILHVDEKDALSLRNQLSAQGVDPYEIEANSFAANLLMPRELLAGDLSTIRIDPEDTKGKRTIKLLADKYEVSEQALLIRLGTLGFIR